MPAFAPERLRAQLAAFPDARRCWIAFSGGMDSQVLLHAAASLRKNAWMDVRAVHVDHGLHRDSTRWADHCRVSCRQLLVPLEVHRVQVLRDRGESLEAVARDRRYQAFSQLLGSGDLLLTAHHRDDQAETLLLALMRGSGLRGLAAMPAVAPLGAGHLVRPLLTSCREELRAYAQLHGLSWVEDPTNASLRFDRNFLRHRVLPLLSERWQGCSSAVARTAGHCAEAQQIIEALSEREIALVAGKRPGTLSISRLKDLDHPLRKAVLLHWIAGRGFLSPGSRRLDRIIGEVLSARRDAAPLVAWAGCEVRRYRDDLFAIGPLPPSPGPQPIRWISGSVSLPNGLGRLRLLGAGGEVIDPSGLFRGGVSVRFGVEGLLCRPVGMAHSRPLKKLFQEAGVPPWVRRYLPLVFAGEALVAIGDGWVCDPGPAGKMEGLKVCWQQDPRGRLGL